MLVIPLTKWNKLHLRNSLCSVSWDGEDKTGYFSFPQFQRTVFQTGQALIYYTREAYEDCSSWDSILLQLEYNTAAPKSSAIVHISESISRMIENGINKRNNNRNVCAYQVGLHWLTSSLPQHHWISKNMVHTRRKK